MELKSCLRRTQSLKSVLPSCDRMTWTLRDRKASVSQLVAKYQDAVEAHNGDPKPKIAPSYVESKETHLEHLIRRSDERVRFQTGSNLSRSKSLGSLQSSPGSVVALKARYESKDAVQNKIKGRYTAANVTSPYKAADVSAKGGAEEEKPRKQPNTADASVVDAPRKAKEDHVTKKVRNHLQTERRKTIGGIDFERITASQTDEKRRWTANVKGSALVLTKEKPCLSVRAMSALYLSKVAPQETKGSPSKPARDQSTKLIKFQPTCHEMCSACLKPVYSMEKITADKYIFHRTCFCCKQCKKKLSMHNYAPLYGEFYCVFHYQQLFKIKGNYDEGFGRTQHKDRWLLRHAADRERDETEA